MIEYKTWEGNKPHVIILDSLKAIGILYYETGFEQLHPLPDILKWMEERGYKYRDDWTVVKLQENPTIQSEWAICFKEKKVCELFVLKWL